MKYLVLFYLPGVRSINTPRKLKNMISISKKNPISQLLVTICKLFKLPILKIHTEN